MTSHSSCRTEELSALPAVELAARLADAYRVIGELTAQVAHMHTGDRSAPAIDAGGVLPCYSGVIACDAHHGYAHLTDALHAWCGGSPAS